MTAIEKSHLSLQAARAAIARAARALGISLVVVGCSTDPPERCLESASGYISGSTVYDRCPKGARVAVEYFNDRTWVMCRCGSADGGGR